MKIIILKLIFKCIPIEWLSRCIAICIARILNYASVKGGKTWDTSKKIIKNVEIWIKLFNEVYEDDTLDHEEEIKIATAIENMTTIKKIKNIVDAED